MLLSYTKFQMVRSGKFHVDDSNPNSVYDASLIHPTRSFRLILYWKRLELLKNSGYY
jgi:hypothetical protein